MNLLLKKPYKKHFSMQNKINDKRSEHKKKLKEDRKDYLLKIANEFIAKKTI